MGTSRSLITKTGTSSICHGAPLVLTGCRPFIPTNSEADAVSSRGPLIGAHVDSSGGLHLAFERAKAMDADAIQCHPTPPGFWGSPKLDETRIATFKEAADRYGHPPFYFHAVYLINLAGDDTTLRQRSESTLTGYLRAADDLGISGVIFHTGSHKGAGFEKTLPTIIGHLQKVLERADPKQARLLIENNAGLGGCVGARFEEIATMMAKLKDKRVGLGSNRDRHANIGAGQIGDEGFRALLHEPRLDRMPFILEVPGAGEGPDAEQVATLRRLAAS